MSESNIIRSFREWARTTITSRWVTLLVAATVLTLGVYPGPMLLLARDPAWRTDVIVSRIGDERAFWIAGFLVVVGPAVVLANMLSNRFDRAWTSVEVRLGRTRGRAFMIVAAGFAAAAAAAASVYVVSRKPTTSDEIAQLWHARMLLAGRLWLPADPNPEFFAIDNVIDRGRWYSQFPIGGPAAFALAMWLHATWLLNPLLTGLTVVNVYRFASRAYGAGEARLVALLCATCPFLLLMGGSYMNHTLVVYLTTLALAELPVCVGDGSERRRLIASVVFGLSLGLSIAVRPLDGAIATLAFGGYGGFAAMRQRRLGELGAAAVSGAVPIAWLLTTNWLTTGHPLLFGYEVMWGANHSLGFHADPSGNPHTPARALALASAYLVQLNWSLFEWPIAGLLVVSAALIAIGRLGRWDTVLVIWIGVQLAAYAAYWHAGSFFGPRYLFTVVPAFLLLATRGLALIGRRSSPTVRRSVIAGVAASVVGSWAIPTTPVGAFGAAKAARPVRAAFKIDIEPAMSSIDGGKALVFVREPASGRLMRRMWGLGISRPDAARLVATKDNCALLDVVLDEAQRSEPVNVRLSRLERTKSYAPPAGWRLLVSDFAFRTSDRKSITPRCREELSSDVFRGGWVSYGQALLRNTIGPDGRITGPIVLVADLAEHNEVLRARFGDRPWYRLDFVEGSADDLPQLVPYK
jgi:uncharacterized membrane protein